MSNIYIHCTAKLAKALKVKLNPAPDLETIEPQQCWYANVLKIGLPLDIVLYTNATSLYSLVHPFDRRDPVDYTLDVFGQRFNEKIGQPLATTYEYVYCKTASKKVLGCMNELAFMLEHKARHLWESGESVDLEEIESFLNQGIVGGIRPVQELEKIKSSSFVKAPHLRVVK